MVHNIELPIFEQAQSTPWSVIEGARSLSVLNYKYVYLGDIPLTKIVQRKLYNGKIKYNSRENNFIKSMIPFTQYNMISLYFLKLLFQGAKYFSETQASHHFTPTYLEFIVKIWIFKIQQYDYTSNKVNSPHLASCRVELYGCIILYQPISCPFQLPVAYEWP